MSMRTALMEMANNQLDEAKTVLSNFMNDRKKEQIIHLAKQKGLKVKDMGDKIEVSGPKGKVADMTVIHKPVRERAAWVPESIADEQVEAFMEATVAAITEGEDTFVFEGKHYKAKTKKEDKLDPVGKEDDDVDNDGDVDSSDKYLKKRRSAIKKSMAMDEEQVEEAVSVKKKDYKWGRMMTVHHGKSHSYPLHPEHQAAIKKLGDNEKTSFKDETGTKVTAHRQGDTVHLSSSKTNTKTPVAHSHFKESVEESAGTAQHGPDDATSDTWDKQMSNGENDIPMGKKKDFVDQHNMEVAYDAEAIYKQNKYEALSKTPARPGDKSDGDKNVVNPIPTNMVDGMRAALAKMKNSGE